MRAGELHEALTDLARCIARVDQLLKDMRAEPDPLASYILQSRRHFRHIEDVKSGSRSQRAIRIGWQRASELGFRGDLNDWAELVRAWPTSPSN